MRSVATSSTSSPRSYTSRTFPRRTGNLSICVLVTTLAVRLMSAEYANSRLRQAHRRTGSRKARIVGRLIVQVGIPPEFGAGQRGAGRYSAIGEFIHFDAEELA